MKLRWLFWIMIAAFIYLIISQWAVLQSLIWALLQANWVWLMVAALLDIFAYLIYVALYTTAFRSVGLHSRFLNLLPVTFAAIFVNSVAPLGGASGSALFIDDAARHGEPGARAVVGILLVYLANFTSFLLVLVTGLAYLLTYRAITGLELGAASLMFLLTAVIGGLILLSIWRPQLLMRLLGWVRRLVNRIGAWFKRPMLLEEGWVEQTGAEINQAGVEIKNQPAGLGRSLLFGLAGHLVNIACLFMVALAFNHPLRLGTLVAGYTVGTLFWIITITPQGIGLVPGFMGLVFVTLGIPVEPAVATAITFRGLSFWLPFLIGFILLRQLPLFQAADPPERQQADL